MREVRVYDKVRISGGRLDGSTAIVRKVLGNEKVKVIEVCVDMTNEFVRLSPDRVRRLGAVA
jgi:hypothetical protein